MATEDVTCLVKPDIMVLGPGVVLITVRLLEAELGAPRGRGVEYLERLLEVGRRRGLTLNLPPIVEWPDGRKVMNLIELMTLVHQATSPSHSASEIPSIARFYKVHRRASLAAWLRRLPLFSPKCNQKPRSVSRKSPYSPSLRQMDGDQR